MLDEGRITEVGSYQQLLSHCGAFSEFLKNYLLEAKEEEFEEPEEEDGGMISFISHVLMF